MTERIFSNGHCGWEQRITHWLIHRAARAAPESLSDRFEEEWLADLAARSGVLSRLRFAIGCCWATRVIAYEHEPSRGPVVSPLVADKTLAAYTDRNFGFLSLRSSTFCLVAMLHALLLYGFMTALSHTHGTATPDPLQYRDLKTPIRRELPLRLPTPHLKDMNIEVPIPDTHIRYEPDPDEGVTTEILKEPSQTSPPQPSPPHVITQVQGGPGAGFPNPDEYYPERSRLLDEQGIATVQVCVDAKGRLTSEPATLQSAGSLRLDEGALRLAKAGSGHYRPSLEDGQPVKSCYPLRIRFQLRH